MSAFVSREPDSFEFLKSSSTNVNCDCNARLKYSIFNVKFRLTLNASPELDINWGSSYDAELIQLIDIGIQVLHVKKQVESLTVCQLYMSHFRIVCWRQKVLIVLDNVTQPLLVYSFIIVALTLASQLPGTGQNKGTLSYVDFKIPGIEVFPVAWITIQCQAVNCLCQETAHKNHFPPAHICTRCHLFIASNHRSCNIRPTKLDCYE